MAFQLVDCADYGIDECGVCGGCECARGSEEGSTGDIGVNVGADDAALAEELWEMLGHEGGLWTVSWPAFNAELAKDEEVEIVVQVLGKVRGRVKVAAGASEDEGAEVGEGGCGSGGASGGKVDYEGHFC